MITAAIVVAGESSSTEARELLAAIGGSTDAPVELVPLIDPPGAVVLHALPDASAAPADALTLLVFCGHVVRDNAGRLFFVRADETPTPLTAVPIDAVRAAIQRSRRPIVVIFDCIFADDDRFVSMGDRLGALEQSFAGLAVGVMVSNARSMGLHGGIARLLANGIATRAADLDRDGVLTLDELFAFASRRVEQVGLPPQCIVSSTRARAMAVIRYRDRKPFDEEVQVSADQPLPAAAAPLPRPPRRYTAGRSRVPPSASPPLPPSLPPPSLPPPSLPPPSSSAPPRGSAPPPPPPVPPSSPPTGGSGTRPAAPPVPRRRLRRPIALVGTAALGAAAVLGAFASTGGKSSRSASPPTFAVAPTTSTSFAATGRARLAAECTRGRARFAVAVATSPSAVRPAVSAILSIDNGPNTRISLVRTAGDVTAPPGVSLYAAELAPFERAGTLRWSVQLSAAADVRSIAIQCGRTVQVLSH